MTITILVDKRQLKGLSLEIARHIPTCAHQAGDISSVMMQQSRQRSSRPFERQEGRMQV